MSSTATPARPVRPARPGRAASAPVSEARLRPELVAAAGYLGMRESELLERLDRGATLRQLARERNRPLGRLVQTMVDIARARLQGAVRAGSLTQGQLEELVGDLRERIERSASRSIPFPPVGAVGAA